ncbi:MAG: XcyI family restriction endonuclease [Phycisphaerae bacterium]|nr:XcyI family restriction endonuclease [Phycisphaerae bacterium]
MKEAGGLPHQVFAHPNVIIERPHLIAYYRNIVTISKKGIGQLLFSTEGYESGRKEEIAGSDARGICETLNRILSGVIEDLPDYTVELSRQAILAEIGTELQGTWANVIGQGAARAVEQLLAEHIDRKEIGERLAGGGFALDNGWSIVFGSEPDAAFFDSDGAKQIAIEIKGSLDKAGAQTRYGEAKKSFAKQLRENPRCHTVYLASCFTDAVIKQIKQDGQVREWFNLTSILYDEAERKRFLNRLFHIVKTPT